MVMPSSTITSFDLLWFLNSWGLLWLSDSRFLSYTPSVLATAIMVSVARDFKEAEYESQLMTLLKVDPVCGVTIGSINGNVVKC